MKTVCVAFALPLATNAVETTETHRANPIRKVVTLLQNMEKKVTSEGEKEKELYDKYMCYCKNGASALQKSISDAGNKMPELESAIGEAEGHLKQLKADIKTHQNERSAAKTAMSQATAVREKEAAEYAKAVDEDKTNLAAMQKAVKALESGMEGAFLQTATAQTLRKIILAKDDMNDGDRQEIVSFLSDREEYAPASGEIIGILKQMASEMDKEITAKDEAEKASIASFEGLIKAKTKEVAAATKMIEAKLGRVGELGVEIVEMKNDLGDTGESLIEDKKFLADLDKNCESKRKLFQENVKMRGQEILALQDTIKVLNDDDALELFKKTLPGAGASSFVQLQVSSAEMRQRALDIIRASGKNSVRRSHFDFISLALHGKKIGFDKVIKMIDDLVVTIQKEQQDDADKQEYCEKQFDTSADKKKALERDVSDLETAIADAKEAVQTLVGEIDALGDSIRALDKSVAEATEQRKEEASDYTTLMASDTAAVQLLEFAKNRLNKFYNPKLYKAPPKRELSEEDRITLNNGGTLAPTAAPGGIAGTGISAMQEAPAPPPEAFEAYSKKSEESGGVIAMIDLLIKDLDKEMTEAKFTEKDAQEDYETFMKDSAAKRAEDSKALSDKEGSKAQLEMDLQEDTENKATTVKELMATEQYIASLHAECDWLLKYFDVRTEARTSEIEGLKNAKAVLSGADYSLLQLRSKSFLRRH